MVSSASHSLNQWHHALIIFDNGTNKIYLDGILKASTSGFTTTTNAHSLRFGAPRGAIAENLNFNGKIDDIRIYNRVLTSCEIGELYSEISTSCEVSLGADQTVCSGGSVTLSAASTSGVSSYLWSNGATTSSIEVNPLQSTNYYATITTDGGCVTSDTVMITVPVSNLSTGLVAYYPFNGNANDESGNGNNGTVNGAALTTDRLGNANGAYSFDGVDDYVNIGSNSSLTPSFVTLSTWFKSASTSNGMIIYRTHAYGYQIGMGDGKIAFRAYTGTGVSDDLLFITSSTYNDNQWHNAVLTYDGNNFKCYIDGTLLNTIPKVSSGLYYVGNYCTISKDGPSGSMYFNGYIDDTKIYNRALNTCEVEALYDEVTTVNTYTCSVNLGVDREICEGENLVLNAEGDSISTYLWSTGDTTAGITVTPSANTYYSIQTTHENGCQAGDTVLVALQSCISSTITPICMVGVDSISNKNSIVWDKPSATDIDSFIIYKESNQTAVYTRLGAKPYAAFSTYTDTNSNPLQQAYLYKLATKYSNGETSGLSIYHKTIHLTISEGLGNTWNLIWNHYEGITYNSYNIYRASGNKKTMTLLTSLSGSLNSFTDLTPPTGNVYYQIEVVNTSGCTPGKKESYSASRSNIATNEVVGIEEGLESNDVRIYPNPNNGEFTVEIHRPIEKGARITLFNSLGQEVYGTILIGEKANLTLNGLTKGVYLLRVNSDDASTIRKVVVE